MRIEKSVNYPDLRPVAFDQHPAARPAHPVVGHPMRVRTRRKNPGAARPDVSVAIPAVIARRPDVARARSDRSVLHDRAGRPDVNVNLSIGLANREQETESGR